MNELDYETAGEGQAVVLFHPAFMHQAPSDRPVHELVVPFLATALSLDRT